MDHHQLLGKIGTLDALHLLIGEQIGEGLHRTVHECGVSKDYVVKIEKGGNGVFANSHEFALWEQVAGHDLQRWFAPCIAVSPCGVCLVQAKTEPIKDTELPSNIPWFFTDLKKENWGRRKDGQIVCHDYAITRFARDITMYKDKIRMRKVKWDF